MRTPSGLVLQVLRPGTGTVHPEPTSMVRVHYTGWTSDGQVLDSSIARGAPVDLPLSAVIPGWSEGVRTMVEGERVRLWIPSALGYPGRPGLAGGPLVFDIELIAIVR